MTYPKMHSWKLVIFYLVAACSLSKEVQAKSWASVGNFDIVESDTLCAAFAKYSFDGRSDVKLMLMLGEDDLPFLTVTSLDWSAQDGTEYLGVTYALNGFVYSDYKDDDGKMVVLTKGDVSESGYKGFYRLFTKDFLDDFAKGDSLLIKNGDDVVTHINLYNSGAAVANLKQCVAYLKGINAEKRDREAQWDYIKKDPFTPKNPYADPAAKLAPNQTAIAKGEVSLWVTGNDYPLRDLQQENEGKVSFTLKIGPDGRVISCDITISSGYPGLDQATCANVSRRARFIPATDTEAKPIEGTYSTAVRWNIPQAVPTIDSPTQ